MKIILLALIILLLISITNQAKADDKPLQGQAKLDSLVEVLTQANGDTSHVTLLMNLSFTSYTINPDEGIMYGMKGVETAQKVNWKKGEADCYNTIAINYAFGKSDYTESQMYYQKALTIYKQIDFKRGIANVFSNIANNYLNQSDYNKSLDYYLKALEINMELTNTAGIAANLGNIGIVYQSQSNYTKSLEYYLKALKMYEELGSKSNIARNLGNIGVTYNELSEYNKSLEYYLKALKMYEELGSKSNIALNLSNIGVVYYNLSDNVKALEYYNKALFVYEELGNESGIALTLGNIANIYIARSNYIKALEYIDKSISISTKIGDKSRVASSLSSIGSLYLNLSEDTLVSNLSEELLLLGLNKEISLNKSIESSSRAIKIFDEIGSLKEQMIPYANLYQAYYRKGMFKKSIDAHVTYKFLQDSIFSKENQFKLVALEKAREDDIKQKEIEKQKIRIAEQEKREQLILYFSIGLVLLMTVVMIVIYRLLKRSDKLLYNVLPVSIAKRLKKKEHPISDYFTQASIVFIDIVNFTEMAQDATPQNLVSNLNTIFTKFDTLANKYGLEKIKTIGDSYMAAAGIPKVQKNNTHRAAQMALEVKEMMKDYHTADGTKIEVRIGLDCGPVVAGVIGENKFIYDMWSDAVNTASRMESSSIAGEVHVSERFKEAVTEYEEFDYVERGEIDIKGKGKMKTFFIGERKAEVV